MSMRPILLAMFAVVLADSMSGAAEKPRLPNVVMIYADDMGYSDVGCYGAKGWSTPNLDRMAKEGVRFTDFYVAQAVCSASRTALLTGCYPNRVGILGALGPPAKSASPTRRKRSRRCSNRAATPRLSTASGTSAISRSSCRRATASTTISACPTPTTCGRSTRRASFRRCR